MVTGKLDVREAAARLPDEQEALDEISDAMTDADEAAGDADLDTAAEEAEA